MKKYKLLRMPAGMQCIEIFENPRYTNVKNLEKNDKEKRQY
jgi:hypothetical protein